MCLFPLGKGALEFHKESECGLTSAFFFYGHEYGSIKRGNIIVAEIAYESFIKWAFSFANDILVATVSHVRLRYCCNSDSASVK